MRSGLVKSVYKSLLAFILLWGVGRLNAETKAPIQHPKDQIALQLGAIQMGYAIPFTLPENISAEKMQEAVNALVMGRNSLNATVANPAEKVQGAQACPSVDSVEYRDQLYSAVRSVVASPVVATIKGNAMLANNVRVSVAATKLTRPSSEWTMPMRYTLAPSLSEVTSQVVDGLISTRLMPAEFAPVMISVTGGVRSVGSGLSGQSVPSFQVGKYEVTCEEWQDVQAWAVSNGYADLDGIGGGGGEQNPVVSVSWHDVVKWCNAKSEKEGMVPVYKVGGATYKIGESVPTVDGSANGYRLPTESEWEWAARGGMETKGFTYSGSNDANAVAWYYSNSPEGPKEVGMKAPNELGIYDMSGNVYEWCWDLCDQECPHRRFRGGSCINLANYCTVAFRDNLGYPNNRLNCIGFRLARSSEN